jgi:hypothetical protein
MSELVLNLLNKLSKEEIITLLFSHENKQKLIKELLEYIGWLKTDQIIVVLDVFSKKQIVESIIFGLTPFGGAELFKKLITKMSKEELISTIASDCSWIKNYGSRLKGLQENVAKDIADHLYKTELIKILASLEGFPQINNTLKAQSNNVTKVSDGCSGGRRC